MTGDGDLGAAVLPMQLAYEDVPQRAAVVENGDVVELVIPSSGTWRLWAVRQAVAGTASVVLIASLYSPVLFMGWPATGALAAMVAIFLVAFAFALLLRLLKAPPATILRWDGEKLTAPSYISVGRDNMAGDSPKWSRAAIADIQVRPLWPAALTGCGTVKVVSRYDYPMHLGVYPLEPLREAVAQFRDIVLAPSQDADFSSK